jgi:hypothetical protein
LSPFEVTESRLDVDLSISRLQKIDKLVEIAQRKKASRQSELYMAKFVDKQTARREAMALKRREAKESGQRLESIRASNERKQYPAGLLFTPVLKPMASN